MTDRRMRMVAAAASLTLMLGMTACGDDDDEATGDSTTSEDTTSTSAETTTSVSTTEAPTTEAPTTAPPTSAADCVGAAEGATAESSATGDVDGDGTDDTLEVLHDGAGTWFLQVTLGSGGSTVMELTTDGVGGAEMIGAADIDEDGKEELFVQTGAGASAAIIGIFTVQGGCDLEAVTFDGAPAAFPVGASIGATSGLQCSNAPEPPGIFAFAGASSDGQTYDVTTAELQLSGTLLTQVGETTGTANYGDELYTAASTFHCDDVTYGA